MHWSKIRLATRKRHAVFPRTMLMPCPKTLAITGIFPGGRNLDFAAASEMPSVSRCLSSITWLIVSTSAAQPPGLSH